ncbi:uncharacterized protein BT62DRAFT_925537 [Guyanagaster necrorhizus]|uniref:F-box domain-containing protein n=1 Tax=Guyanagaster necrorhizus TaxID=856835 RepID=A0A9P7W5T1_9AGAR|nr:uncharacterized protein BT62DRAFT_925537 [Guyanagaster necrorhizus MCA 3950]KAG7452995.1 hypothetical protein BT62DRAFT_925537 [Guyanagaster necrorhizus MCA 3950]
MSSPLPQEIVDQITDELQEDFTTLKACALVSRSWKDSSQRHIFSDIFFETPPEPLPLEMSPCHIFHRLLTTSPHLGRHVRHLEICDEGRTSDSTRRWILASVETLMSVISLLKCLSSVDISFSGLWWEDVLSLKNVLVAIFQLESLRSVALEDFQVRLNELFSLLQSRSIRDLSISAIEVLPDLSPPLQRSVMPLHELSLSLQHMQHAQDFMEWLISPTSVVNLSVSKKLSLFVANSDEAKAAQVLLESPILRSPDILEIQTLNCSVHMHRREECLPPHFSRFRHVQLRLVEALTCEYCGNSLLEIVLWWTRSFEAIEDNNIEEISLTLTKRSASRFHHVPNYVWHALDAALCRPRMSSLRNVHLGVEDLEIDKALLLRLLQAFPLLYHRGLLRV